MPRPGMAQHLSDPSPAMPAPAGLGPAYAAPFGQGPMQRLMTEGLVPVPDAPSPSMATAGQALPGPDGHAGTVSAGSPEHGTGAGADAASKRSLPESAAHEAGAEDLELPSVAKAQSDDADEDTGKEHSSAANTAQQAAEYEALAISGASAPQAGLHASTLPPIEPVSGMLPSSDSARPAQPSAYTSDAAHRITAD